MQTLKRCGKCQIVKECTLFFVDTARPDGRYPCCKACEQKRNKARVKQSNAAKKANYDPAKERARYYKNKKFFILENQFKNHYGIDFEDWARMYEEQLGRCIICLADLVFDRHTHVDHSHKTGRVRGLLCHMCNLLLGHCRDNEQTLERALEYLRANA